MDIELTSRHRQVIGLEALRRKRGYKEGWLYHLCLQKGLLKELHELQLAGRLSEDEAEAPSRPAPARRPGEAARTLLTVELVPTTCWFSNLRSELPPKEWDKLQRATFERAGRRCEICGGKGRQHPVECHEIWEYNDETHVQRLAGLIALCPACHEAKHIGLASSRGHGGSARAHLARVNGWSMEDVEAYLEVEYEQWSRRSTHQWTLDISWLDEQGVTRAED